MKSSVIILTTTVLIMGCITTPKSGESNISSNCEHTPDTFKCVEYLSNYDGDTITFNIPHTHPLFGTKISVRVRGLDTPELRGRPTCEKDLAKVAKERVQTLLSKAKRIDLTEIGRDKYFRVLANVVVDGQSLSTILLEQNLAYQYDGGTKRKVNWCNDPPAIIHTGGE